MVSLIIASEDFITEQFVEVRSLGNSITDKIILIKNITTGELLVKKELNSCGDVLKVIKKLRAPYFPQIHYIIGKPDSTTVIEAYIEGKPLSEDRFGGLPERTKIHGLLELCDAVALLHQHHIIHRDIKPGNILLTDDRHIKLIDFDAARIKSAYAEIDTRPLGTPGFAPPEQYGFTQTDERTDIYAMGQLIEAVWGSRLPASLSRIVRRCTRFDPQQRFASVAQLKSALIHFEHRKCRMAFLAAAIIGGLLLSIPMMNPAEIIANNFKLCNDCPEEHRPFL